MKIMRRSKKSGMTTFELMVSGGVMLGVIVMGFDVMLAGVQVSKKASNDSQANEQNRSLLEVFTRDVQSATSIEGGLNLGIVSLASDKDQVILKVPKFDPQGRRIANKFQLIGYYISSKGSGKCIKRMTSDYNGLTVSNVSSPEIVLSNLKEVEFSYGITENISYDSVFDTFHLPGDDTKDDTPGSGNVHLMKVRCSWDSTTLDGRPAIDASGLKFTTCGFRYGSPAAGDSVQATYMVSPNLRKSLLSSELKANFVKIKVEVKKNDDDDDVDDSRSTGASTMISTASLRNAE